MIKFTDGQLMKVQCGKFADKILMTCFDQKMSKYLVVTKTLREHEIYIDRLSAFGIYFISLFIKNGRSFTGIGRHNRAELPI